MAKQTVLQQPMREARRDASEQMSAGLAKGGFISSSAASLEIAANLEKETLLPVFVGFNEFCSPSIRQAIENVIEQGAEKVLVISAMMTRGGEHSEKEIPNTIKELEKEYPQVKLVYAYPFLSKDIARFLASQVRKFDPQGE
ncbi:MAG: hypothetical protein HGB26_08350 [Desulfobulbaceae bacterium]|nr:hypothetical protein [Desulfobulbaceae bacterium]